MAGRKDGRGIHCALLLFLFHWSTADSPIPSSRCQLKRQRGLNVCSCSPSTYIGGGRGRRGCLNEQQVVHKVKPKSCFNAFPFISFSSTRLVLSRRRRRRPVLCPTTTTVSFYGQFNRDERIHFLFLSFSLSLPPSPPVSTDDHRGTKSCKVRVIVVVVCG